MGHGQIKLRTIDAVLGVMATNLATAGSSRRVHGVSLTQIAGRPVSPIRNSRNLHDRPTLSPHLSVDASAAAVRESEESDI